MFISPVYKWQSFINSSSSPSWGRSFHANVPVNSVGSWLAAVKFLRAASSKPGDPEFFEWLQRDKSAPWDTLVASLTVRKADSPAYKLTGSPAFVLQQLRALGIRAMAVWNVDCGEFDFSTMDPKSRAYWGERWELYRLFYLGGRFMAANGVRDVELYNEVDHDAAECMTPAKWRDHYRIRSMALQNGYADFSSQAGRAVEPNIAGPPTASTTFSQAYDGAAIERTHELFPSGFSAAWHNVRAFSYHQYSRSGSDAMRQTLANLTAAVQG